MKKIIYFTIILNLLYSCNYSIEHTWVINKFILDNNEVELNVNMIIFKKENKCRLPQLYNVYNRTEGEWEFLGKNQIRIFNSEYSIFDGNYTYEIEKNNTLNLVLKSERIEIHCHQ